MRFIFHLFSPAHLAVIASVPLAAALLAFMHRRFGRDHLTRYLLAALLFLTTVASYVNLIRSHQPIYPAHLPLELCDASLWLMMVALIFRKGGIFDIAWYWALAGASMAILTPNFSTPTYFEAFEFFMSHCLTVAAALYLVWTRQQRPRPWSVARAMIAVNAMAVLSGTVDYFYGTDYMYLRAKPVEVTLLTYLGPWPWYILSTEFVGLFLFVLLYLPFRHSRRQDGNTRRGEDARVTSVV